MTDHSTAPTKWEARDVPSLRVAADLLDEVPNPVRATSLADEAQLTTEQCVAAARALISSGHLVGKPSGSMQGVYEVILTDVTERGRRAAGLWPAEETVEAFQAALLEAATRSTDPEEAGFLRRFAAYVGTAGRDFIVDVGAAVAAKSLGA